MGPLGAKKCDRTPEKILQISPERMPQSSGSEWYGDVDDEASEEIKSQDSYQQVRKSPLPLQWDFSFLLNSFCLDTHFGVI